MFIKPHKFRYTDGKTNFDIKKMGLMWTDSSLLGFSCIFIEKRKKKRCKFPREGGQTCAPLGGITAGDPGNRRRYQPTPGSISSLDSLWAQTVAPARLTSAPAGRGPSQTGKALQLRDPNAYHPPGPPADTQGAETCVGVGVVGYRSSSDPQGLCLLAVRSQ